MGKCSWTWRMAGASVYAMLMNDVISFLFLLAEKQNKMGLLQKKK